MPFSALKVKLIDPTFINVYDFETLLKQFQHLFRTLLSHNQATFGVPLERHPLDFVEAHVKLVFQNAAYHLVVQFYSMLCFDSLSNLFESPNVFAAVLETLDSAYGCHEFSFFGVFFFKQLSRVIYFDFEVPNDSAYCPY